MAAPATKWGAWSGPAQAGNPAESSNMKKYELFSEWRGIKIIGEDLPDALKRAKTLRAPDKIGMHDRINAEGNTCGRGPEIEVSGAVYEISKIHKAYIPEGHTRGGKPYEVAVVEFTDGTIKEVDAVCVLIY